MKLRSAPSAMTSEPPPPKYKRRTAMHSSVTNQFHIYTYTMLSCHSDCS